MSSFRPYSPVHTLKGHTKAINAVSFSPCGRYILTSSNDNTAIFWDSVKGSNLHEVRLASPITCHVWKTSSDVFLGCQNGELTLYQRFMGRESGSKKAVLIGVDAPVYTLDFNKKIDCLGVGVGSEVQIAGKVAKTYATTVILPAPSHTKLKEHRKDDRLRPLSIHFLPCGSQLIAGYLNHGIVCWDISTKMSLWSMDGNSAALNSPIGGTALSGDVSRLLVFDMLGIIGLFALGVDAPVQTFCYSNEVERVYPTSVVFLNNEAEVSSGSPTGKIHIWNTKTGHVEQILDHGDNVIQAVSAFRSKWFNFLAVATSLDEGDNFIRVWSAPVDSQGFFQWILQCTMLKSTIQKIRMHAVGLKGFAGLMVVGLVFIRCYEDSNICFHLATSSLDRLALGLQSAIAVCVLLAKKMLHLLLRLLKPVLRALFASLLDD